MHNRVSVSLPVYCRHAILSMTNPSRVLRAKIDTGTEYTRTDKSLARPTSRCILFDGENNSFDASHVMYINSTNIPPIMTVNRIYENQNLLSL